MTGARGWSARPGRGPPPPAERTRCRVTRTEVGCIAQSLAPFFVRRSNDSLPWGQRAPITPGLSRFAPLTMRMRELMLGESQACRLLGVPCWDSILGEDEQRLVVQLTREPLDT
jgi:hypothetical protein